MLATRTANSTSIFGCSSTVLAPADHPSSAPTARPSPAPAALCFVASLPASGLLHLSCRSLLTCYSYIVEVCWSDSPASSEFAGLLLLSRRSLSACCSCSVYVRWLPAPTVSVSWLLVSRISCSQHISSSRVSASACTHWPAYHVACPHLHMHLIHTYSSCISSAPAAHASHPHLQLVQFIHSCSSCSACSCCCGCTCRCACGCACCSSLLTHFYAACLLFHLLFPSIST